MARGLPEAEPAEAPDRDAVLAAEVAVIRASGEFDEFGYMWHNPDLRWHLCTGPEQAIHFAERGWHEMRHPSPGFDLWHYTNAHLDPEDDEVNPVVHYALEGRRHGLDTLPEVRQQPAPTAPSGSPRRVCLFAAFDVDGIIDPTVVSYLADLSRFADVYYLADCELEDGELDKIAPYTKDAWALRHGRYDFGSYSMLATDLVGWDVIDTYDEMMLANDSGWLVQPLDTVFAKMDATACDWWGLQATYEDFGVKEFEELGRPLALDDVEEQMRQQDLWRYSDFIHVGSYFLVYRRRVLQDPGFRRRLEDRGRAARQDRDHPQVRDRVLALPHPQRLPPRDLHRRDPAVPPGLPGVRLRPHGQGLPAPEAAVPLREPLLRARPPAVEGAGAGARPRRRRRGDGAQPASRLPGLEPPPRFAIRSRPDGTAVLPEPLGPETFPDEDRWVPSFDHWWGFPADPRTGLLSGAVRAVFDAVRDDPSIKKIVLEGSRPLGTSGPNVVRVATESPPGQMHSLRMGTIFTSVGPRSTSTTRSRRGTTASSSSGARPGSCRPTSGSAAAATRGGCATLGPQLDDALTRVVVVAGAEGAAAAAGLPRLDPDGAWELGSPRIDLLVADEDRLAAAHVGELGRLRALLDGRRLVVVEPWDQAIDLAPLADWAQAHPEVAVGVRRAGPGSGSGSSPLPAPLLDLADRKLISDSPKTLEPVLPENTAWRLADVLVSGSAADLADWAVLGLGAVSLVDGVPLPVTAAAGLPDALDAALAPGAPAAYLAWGRALHRASDGHAAERVVLAIKRTYQPIDAWLADEEPVTAPG